MNENTPKHKQKITDITPPRKSTGAGLPSLVIEKRAHLEHDDADSSSSSAVSQNTQKTAAKDTPTEPPQRIAITPLGADVHSDTTQSAADTDTATKPTTTALPALADHPLAKKPFVPPAPASTPSSDATTDTAPGDTSAPGTVPSAANPSSAEAADDQEAPAVTAAEAEDAEAEKASAEAAAAARRDTELEKYIDTKQFFVPINKTAQKRSLKVTLWLTALYIFLCAVLVNLMLDTGMIFLLQKLPHTNFFSV